MIEPVKVSPERRLGQLDVIESGLIAQMQQIQAQMQKLEEQYQHLKAERAGINKSLEPQPVQQEGE